MPVENVRKRRGKEDAYRQRITAYTEPAVLSGAKQHHHKQRHNNDTGHCQIVRQVHGFYSKSRALESRVLSRESLSISMISSDWSTGGLFPTHDSRLFLAGWFVLRHVRSVPGLRGVRGVFGVRDVPVVTGVSGVTEVSIYLIKARIPVVTASFR